MTLTSAPSEALETATLEVEGMRCAGCVSAVERQIVKNDGVTSACVNLVTKMAAVRYERGTVTPETIAAKLTERGFPSQVRASEEIFGSGPSSTEQRRLAARDRLRELAIAIGLLVFSSLGHLHHISGTAIPLLGNLQAHWLLATLALAFPAREILVDGARSLRHGLPNMNALVGLGSVSAYLASCVAMLWPQLGWECFFDEPVMLLGFILLGRTLEARARARASAALEKLLALQPPIARVVGDTPEDAGIEIPAAQVRVGDRLRVLPGEKIPVDGLILTGATAIDEAMLTGEATPVAKGMSDRVAAGTLNQTGAIVLAATQVGRQTALAQIVAAVETAQTRKAPVQKLADTVAGYFAYGVMAIAAATFLFWQFFGTRAWPQVLSPNLEMAMAPHQQVMAMEESMAAMGDMADMADAATSPLLLSVKLAIAVLVIACPCALGLATPTAILVGTSLGAERGLLIEGGDIFERARNITAVIFDKTGTLTEGHPSLTALEPWGARDANDLLAIAAAAESGTNHPLATAIGAAASARQLELPPASDFYTEAGLGITATVAGRLTIVGNLAWLQLQGIAIPADVARSVQSFLSAGNTVVCVAIAGEFAGAIALQDKPRPDARPTVASLQAQGLQVLLLSGDDPAVARDLADRIGIAPEQAIAGVKPTEKADRIRQLQEAGAVVAMVGDGINDAPALAQADVGIALQQGTDVALETANIVLTRNCLLDVPAAIALSANTFGKIRQNLFWALGYNIIAIPLAAGALLPSAGILLGPSLAGAFMAASSILVVTNSLLLRRQFTPGRAAH
ncbi:MAG: heavy metal translocating P-type ATPase [Cyanobacteria bacterium J06641_5]